MSLESSESSGLRESSGEYNWHGVRYVQIDALFLARHWSKRRSTELLRSQKDVNRKSWEFSDFTQLNVQTRSLHAAPGGFSGT